MPRKRKFYNSLTGQAMDKKTGRFKPKPGTKKPAAPIVASGDLMDHLAQYADPRILAKRIDKLARQGDGAMLALLIQAASRRTSAGEESPYKFSRVPEHIQPVFAACFRVARDEPFPQDARLLARIRIPTDYELSLSDEEYAAATEDDEEAELIQEEAEAEPYGFKLAEEAPAPAPAPLEPKQLTRSPALAYLPSDEALERAQPSIGTRRRSLMNFDANHSGGGLFGYDDDPSPHGATSDFDAPPPEAKRKAN